VLLVAAAVAGAATPALTADQIGQAIHRMSWLPGYCSAQEGRR
jgi:hypothetical protein